MSIYWGVVSSHAANSTVHTASGDSALLDFLLQQGQSPQFWGRYIAGKDPQDLLTPEEVAYLFNGTSGNCRILVVHYGINPAGDYQGGVSDALQAVEAAQNLGVPLGVTLYGDIEADMQTNIDWFFGWWETMSASAYANPGGFYCHPSPSNVTNFLGPYCAAITDPRNLNLDGTYRFYPPLFSSSPLVGCSSPAPTQFNPDEPPCAPGSAMIWQYAEGCFQNADYPRGLYDMDLANESGIATLWSL
jgi:hypothetical protein